MLEHMRQRWIDISQNGWHDIVCGYIKDSEMESALEALRTMQQNRVTIQHWLYDMVIYMLCDLGEINEALRLIKQLMTQGLASSSFEVWFYLFDTGCKLLHYDTIDFIWRRRVEADLLVPSGGQCLAVLNAAAREGDILLAIDIFRVLSARGATLEPQHYELLIEAHLKQDDLKTCLNIICVMGNAGVPLDQNTLRTPLFYLRQQPELVPRAYEMLQEIKSKGRDVPTAALNMLIDGALSQDAGLNEAVKYYKSLRKLCLRGPNTETFNILLGGCKESDGDTPVGGKSTAMFLASEMLAMGIKPDSLTYDRLLLVCLAEDEYEDLFKYYDEMERSGWVPRQGTFNAMIKRCCEAGDQRTWTLLQTMSNAGLPTATLHQWVEENWKQTIDKSQGRVRIQSFA